MTQISNWTAEKVAVAKAMLLRGDRQHDIAAYFGVNGGRIAEMCEKWPEVGPARGSLPPAGPYDIPGLLNEKSADRRRMTTTCDSIVDACAELELRTLDIADERGITTILNGLIHCAEVLERPR